MCTNAHILSGFQPSIIEVSWWTWLSLGSFIIHLNPLNLTRVSMKCRKRPTLDFNVQFHVPAFALYNVIINNSRKFREYLLFIHNPLNAKFQSEENMRTKAESYLLQELLPLESQRNGKFVEVTKILCFWLIPKQSINQNWTNLKTLKLLICHLNLLPFSTYGGQWNLEIENL